MPNPNAYRIRPTPYEADPLSMDAPLPPRRVTFEGLPAPSSVDDIDTAAGVWNAHDKEVSALLHNGESSDGCGAIFVSGPSIIQGAEAMK